MKLLEIIIPHYQEKEDVIGFNLRMISLQQGIDFKDIEVMIVNDGDKAYVLQDSYLKSFSPLSIKQITTPQNGGPGNARQYGFDNTKSKYVMYMDADDGFASVVALYNYFKAIKDHPDADLIESDFLYETLENINSNKVKIEREITSKNTWLHTKLFKREFLKKNNIRFFPELRLSEDVAFCTRMCVKNIVRYFIPYDTYFYKTYGNNASLTKVTDSDKMRLTHINASKVALKYCIEHKNMYDDIGMKLYRTLTYCYFLIHSYWNDELSKQQFEDDLLSIFVENFSTFNEISDEIKNASYKDQLEDYMKLPYVTDKEQWGILTKSTYIDMENYFKQKLIKIMKKGV